MFAPFKSFFEHVNAQINGDRTARTLITQSQSDRSLTFRFQFDSAFFDPAGFYFVPVSFFRNGASRIEHDGIAVFQFEPEQGGAQIHAFLTAAEPRFTQFAKRFQFFSDFFSAPARRFAASA